MNTNIYKLSVVLLILTGLTVAGYLIVGNKEVLALEKPVVSGPIQPKPPKIRPSEPIKPPRDEDYITKLFIK